SDWSLSPDCPPSDSTSQVGRLSGWCVGAFRLLALLVAFLCVHCVYGWPSWAAMQFFEVVVLWFLIAFFIFFLMHLFRLQARMPCINWPLTEFFHYSVGTILIFIASIVAAVKSGGVSALVAGSVFGFIATFLMAVSLWTSYTVTCGSHQTGTSHPSVLILCFLAFSLSFLLYILFCACYWFTK
uniref:CKLF-like MARVEL transmembrane domain containing 7 n=1 Tax=Sander lucioperca TaxID=283035 RepID=A0A8C9XEG0_SANLU